MIFTSRNKKLVENVKKLEQLERNIYALNEENKELLNIINKRENVLARLIEEKSIGFPWLAGAIAEFQTYSDVEIENYLKNKSHPAYKSAEAVRVVKREKRLLRKKLKIAQNFVNYYETLFPWITDYVGEDLDSLLDGLTDQKEKEVDEDDPVLKYLPRAEYNKLDTVTRNQKALDRYLNSTKPPHVIGRDYERYIGYLYEVEGYDVEYVGIEKGLEDLGRDLICTKGTEINVVQCKCWALHKTIHEKHINQLYGTAVKHYLEIEERTNSNKELTLFPDLIRTGVIKASFVTSTVLSETAKRFAQALGIQIIQEKKLERYPMIKCNVSQNGEKIYHLPFDQQYDRTKVLNNGGFFAKTVKEAEDAGFRRAYRWRGIKNE